MANRNWRKGDRIVINYSGNPRKPEYYIGTVSRGGASKITVNFDDGDVESYSVSDKSIVGEGIDKKRKSKIPSEKLDQFLTSKKDEKETKTKKVKKVVKKSKTKDEKPSYTVRMPPANIKTWDIPDAELSPQMHGEPAKFAELYNEIQKLRGKTTRQQRQKFHRGDRLTESVKKRVARLEALEKYLPESHPMWKEAKKYVEQEPVRKKEKEQREKEADDFKRLQLAKLNRLGYAIGDEVTMLSKGALPFEGQRLTGTIQQRKDGAIYVRVGRKTYDFFSNSWMALEEFEEEKRKEKEKKAKKEKKSKPKKQADDDIVSFEKASQISDVFDHLRAGGVAEVPKSLFNRMQEGLGAGTTIKVLKIVLRSKSGTNRRTRYYTIKFEDSAPKQHKKESELKNLEFSGTTVRQSATFDVERGVVRINGRNWKARKETGKKAQIIVEEQRFILGDKIKRTTDPGKPKTVVEATYDVKKTWRYTFENRDWARDIFSAEGEGKRGYVGPLVKVGEADVNELSEKKEKLEEKKGKPGAKLKSLVDLGTLYKGQEVKFRTGSSPYTTMNEGTIVDFNFKSGRIKVQPPHRKPVWVKRVWFPGGFWSVT